MWSLELGQELPVNMPYTYARRAQNVTYSLQWQQYLICDDIDPLLAWWEANKANHSNFKARIVGLSADAGKNNIELPP